MKNLTENQKEFIISFFKSDEYTGWKNIATKLVDTGSCIVAGNKSIWNNGGIGNYIKTIEAEGLFGCLQYEFDLNNFLKSAWLKEITGYKKSKILLDIDCTKTKLHNLETELKDISNLIEMNSSKNEIN